MKYNKGKNDDRTKEFGKRVNRPDGSGFERPKADQPPKYYGPPSKGTPAWVGMYPDSRVFPGGANPHQVWNDLRPRTYQRQYDAFMSKHPEFSDSHKDEGDWMSYKWRRDV